MIMRIPYYYSLSLLFFFLLINTTSVLLVSSSLCHSEERTALLQFKQLFSVNCEHSSSCKVSDSTWTDSWIEGTDCCAWDRVECDDVTSHVVRLDLAGGCLYGTIPPNSTLFGLLHLHFLDLSCNNFYSSQISPSFGRLRNLTRLDLSYSSLSGQIPSDFHLPNLVALSLSGNRISGKIPSSLMSFSLDLMYLDLSSNELSGTIEPYMFGKKLRFLFLSANKLSGTIELDSFAKLENLTKLDLSNSGLSLTAANYVQSNIFQNIESLRLSSCNISYFPFELLKNSKSFMMLDLENNNLNEQLHPLICNHSLRYLDLSKNQFYGLLPDCLGNFYSSLQVLNLKRNNFHGTIPQTLGYAGNLLVLDISRNGIEGLVPRSLANCSKLEVLNLGHNLIADVFPLWLEQSMNLKVLVLQDNRFYGSIEPPSGKKSFFNNLHIIDVAQNNFTGTLPETYFESWDFMMVAEENTSPTQYMGNSDSYSLEITVKGIEMELVRILIMFTVVDFSYNKFHGKIPISLGRLEGLHVLNFSGNAFTGPIPLSLESLTNIESFDLSKNKLSGEIPQQLTSLNFLVVFNVSQNNLTGPLPPQVNQFANFESSSYEGNPGLCGQPLSKNCGNIKVPISPSEAAVSFILVCYPE